MGERSLTEIIVEISCQLRTFDRSTIGTANKNVYQFAVFMLDPSIPPLVGVCELNLACSFQFSFRTRGEGFSL